jgi:hypothetical protein
MNSVKKMPITAKFKMPLSLVWSLVEEQQSPYFTTDEIVNQCPAVLKKKSLWKKRWTNFAGVARLSVSPTKVRATGFELPGGSVTGKYTRFLAIAPHHHVD